MEYVFDWDETKARLNARKHCVTFQRASAVFLDRRALSISDDEHGSEEERWVTMGLDSAGNLLVVVHTFAHISPTRCLVRLISTRKATRKEQQQYSEGVA